MLRKSFDPEKELKKAQKKGVYNSKIKMFAIFGVSILTVGIMASYALLSFTSENVAFDSDVNKKVTVNVVVNNGSTANPQIETTYNATTTIAIEPKQGYEYDNLSCTNNQNASFDGNKNYLLVSPTDNTECTINFKPKGKVLAGVIKEETIQTDTTQSGLFSIADIDTNDSFYFKGDVLNNYVSFADKLWRIVRINGDGTIRLIANESVGQSEFNITTWKSAVGLTSGNKKVCTKENPCDGTNSKATSAIQTYLNQYYLDNLIDYDSRLAASTYCNDTSVSEETEESLTYGSAARFNEKTPSLDCADTKLTYGGVYNLKIGLLSIDEVLLSKIYTEETVLTYLDMSKPWWTSSPMVTRMLYTNDDSVQKAPDELLDVYPVINLVSDAITTSGDGSIDTPYIVE